MAFLRMRLLTLALTAMLVLLTFSAGSAQAAGDCTTRDFDADMVRGEVSYGTSCADVEVRYCTLTSDPENPSHPYWVCHTVV